MPRHVLRAALGRATASSTARALNMPISTTTPASFFSTTSSLPAEDSSNNSSGSDRPARPNQTAAVEKLSQLNNRRSSSNYNGNFPQGGRRDALDAVPGINNRNSNNYARGPQGPRRGGFRGVDARALRFSPNAEGGGESGPSSSAPRVLNLRSLRGGLRGRGPFGRPDGALGRPRFGSTPRIGGGAGAGRGGGFSRGGRLGARGGRGGARGRRGRGGLSARGDAVKKAKENKEDGKATGEGKLEWAPEEQEVLDRLDKGEVVPYTPKVTLDTLSGYGAAVATDAPIGQVETALRTMRLMTGGMAFNSDSGVTADVKAVLERYKKKQPVFVHSKEEKAWIESAQPGLRLVGPNEGTKKAIVNQALLGKYEPSGFAETSDVKATMANYHARSFTYMASDSQKFMDKVLSLLPAQGGGQPAARAKQ